MCDKLFLPGTIDGSSSGIYLSELVTFLVFMTVLGFGSNLSGVTLFDDLYIEYFDRGELIYIPGETNLMSLSVEDISGVPGVVSLAISGVVDLGVPSVVALGFPGKTPLWVPSDNSLGIPGVFDYLFTIVFSLGSSICVPVKLFF